MLICSSLHFHHFEWPGLSRSFPWACALFGSAKAVVLEGLLVLYADQRLDLTGL